MLLRLLHFGGTLLLSLALALYLTPIVLRAAVSFGVLDHPDGKLKAQPEPVPYLGGIAVYLAFLITLCVVFDFRPELLGLLLGTTMMAMLGLFDDLHVIAPSKARRPTAGCVGFDSQWHLHPARKPARLASYSADYLVAGRHNQRRQHPRCL